MHCFPSFPPIGTRNHRVIFFNTPSNTPSSSPTILPPDALKENVRNYTIANIKKLDQDLHTSIQEQKRIDQIPFSTALAGLRQNIRPRGGVASQAGVMHLQILLHKLLTHSDKKGNLTSPGNIDGHYFKNSTQQNTFLTKLRSRQNVADYVNRNGSKTMQSVYAFQQAMGITADGFIGPQTFRAMELEVSRIENQEQEQERQEKEEQERKEKEEQERKEKEEQERREEQQRQEQERQETFTLHTQMLQEGFDGYTTDKQPQTYKRSIIRQFKKGAHHFAVAFNSENPDTFWIGIRVSNQDRPQWSKYKYANKNSQKEERKQQITTQINALLSQ